jgi:Transposase, Mutator family
MTSPPIDVDKLLADQLATASPDLRLLVSTFIAVLMSTEADALCGAGYGERSTSRSNRRNRYRHRDFDTRAGTIDVAIPKLRQGSYFPEWLLARHKRAERALTSVVATCYLLGVSTRRMERLVESLGVTSLSDVLRTSLPHNTLPDNEVVARYKGLADVERFFRCMNTELDVRPIRHRLADRVRAHVPADAVLLHQLAHEAKAGADPIY